MASPCVCGGWSPTPHIPPSCRAPSRISCARARLHQQTGRHRMAEWPGVEMSSGGRRQECMRYNDCYASNLHQAALSSLFVRIQHYTSITECTSSYRQASSTCLNPVCQHIAHPATLQVYDSQARPGVTESNRPRLCLHHDSWNR